MLAGLIRKTFTHLEGFMCSTNLAYAASGQGRGNKGGGGGWGGGGGGGSPQGHLANGPRGMNRYKSIVIIFICYRRAIGCEQRPVQAAREGHRPITRTAGGRKAGQLPTVDEIP